MVAMVADSGPVTRCHLTLPSTTSSRWSFLHEQRASARTLGCSLQRSSHNSTVSRATHFQISTTHNSYFFGGVTYTFWESESRTTKLSFSGSRWPVVQKDFQKHQTFKYCTHHHKFACFNQTYIITSSLHRGIFHFIEIFILSRPSTKHNFFNI